MKKVLLCICFNLIFIIMTYAHGITLADCLKVKELSSFRIQDEIDLRIEKDYSAKVKYRTLNHEGGMKVRVLEILKSDVQDNKCGKWFYVLLTAPMWVDTGEWIEKYRKFLIFIPNDMPLFDFEELKNY